MNFGKLSLLVVVILSNLSDMIWEGVPKVERKDQLSENIRMSQDMRKSSVRQKSTEDIINSMNKKEGKYVKALLLVDDEDNIVDSFDMDVDNS
ncbi:hypothetical protein [Enterobacter hormaechei]|uniref:hypothetical protein n=1 Tax=Enterobacter hormaechei TaxID=158836 RepID=UPI003890DBA0